MLPAAPTGAEMPARYELDLKPSTKALVGMPLNLPIAAPAGNELPPNQPSVVRPYASRSFTTSKSYEAPIRYERGVALRSLGCDSLLEPFSWS